MWRFQTLGTAYLWLFLVLAVGGVPVVCVAQDGDADKKLSPYEELWQQVGNLLEAREYGSAAELIADAEVDAEFKPFRKQLKVDRKDIEGLQHLAGLVKDQAAKLKPGEAFKQGSTTYKVVKFLSDAQGNRLILESPNSANPVEKALTELDVKSWITLAQPKLSTSAEDRYILGMFLATVEHGDRKDAREALNLAATDGESVSHWTARLDAEVKALEEAKLAKKAVRDDPIVGTWRLVIGKGKKERHANLIIRAGGKTNSPSATWRKRADGTYALTLPKGGTANIKLTPANESFKGNMANGSPVHGLREAKAKR